MWATSARVWTPANRVLRLSCGLGSWWLQRGSLVGVRACARSCMCACSRGRPRSGRRGGEARGALWESEESRERLPPTLPGSPEPQCVHPENDTTAPANCLLCWVVSPPGDAGHAKGF